MNGNNGNSNEGPKNKPNSSFGIVKNQGRNAFANDSAPQSRQRANAVFEPPGRTRSNAQSEPVTRNRANAVFGAPEGFGKRQNQGRQNSQPPNNTGFGLGEQVKNLGRAAFAKNPDRNNLTFSQKTGFNLMAGFMDKLIDAADKSTAKDSNERPGFLKPPGNTGFNPGGNNDNRRTSLQPQSKNNDDNVTAGEFFKRLQTALQDPAKFKREALQKEQARANQQHNAPPEQQQRLQSSSKEKQPTAQEFFKELRGALKDPAGYKRRVEAQQKQQQHNQAQNPPPPGKNPALPGKNNATTNRQSEGQKPSSSPIKKSPRK
ncbi:hypothetical protein [Planctobacterium marinum]|uniref:hypothetical protein n=1 Tax=Planctobacterium marinum TaxID=1631968 RepID=UPI001E2CE0CC|nr:hypothetical protein [Planctobacterium marinum]MCC2605090.1 hypothetical protein [Planctobacterium marinum]